MLPKKVEDILNQQIEKEGYSSNLYLSMAVWAELNGYNGVAGWMYAQADEEKMHMLKIIKYVNEREGKAVIPAFEQPPYDFKDLEEVFEKTLAHEKYISGSINEIVGVCMEEKDYTTHNWIQWFITEQIEEESSVNEILDKLRLTDGKHYYQFDRDIMSMRGQAGAE